MKPTRGGSRKGSGKKPKPDKRTTRSISLPPATWEKLDWIAKLRKVSRSECVNQLLKD